MCPNRPCGLKWQQTSAPCSMHQTEKLRSNFFKRPSKSTLLLLLGCPPGWRKSWLKDLRSSTFRWYTGVQYARPTAWSGLTKGSAEGPKSWESFQMRPRVSGWSPPCSWRSVRSGRSANTIVPASHSNVKEQWVFLA